MATYNNIVILTGAGLSAESGLGTFRGPGGLWENFRIEDVATPDAFARDPARVHEFYNLRRSWHKAAKPNAAHLALAGLEREHGNVLTVTQNIDALHEAAGSRRLIHMHGELERALCAACGTSAPWEQDLTIESHCASCGKAAMRPDVVWFGEMPREMERIYEALGACDLFISIGTSGAVYPAAGFVLEARAAGAHLSNSISNLPTARICSLRGSKAPPLRSFLPMWTVYFAAKGVSPLAFSAMRFAQFRAQGVAQ